MGRIAKASLPTGKWRTLTGGVVSKLSNSTATASPSGIQASRKRARTLSASEHSCSGSDSENNNELEEELAQLSDDDDECVVSGDENCADDDSEKRRQRTWKRRYDRSRYAWPLVNLTLRPAT